MSRIFLGKPLHWVLLILLVAGQAVLRQVFRPGGMPEGVRSKFPFPKQATEAPV